MNMPWKAKRKINNFLLVLILYVAPLYHNYLWINASYGKEGRFKGQKIDLFFFSITYVPVLNLLSLPASFGFSPYEDENKTSWIYFNGDIFFNPK